MSVQYDDSPIFKGVPVDQAPVSVEAARAEQAELLDSMRSIDAQLGQEFIYLEKEGRRLNRKEYDQWRRRAVDAKRHAERRYRYVKDWLKDQGSGAPKPTPYMVRAGSTATGDAHALAKRVGAIEAIAISAVAFVRETTPDQLKELTRLVGENAERAGL